MVKPSQKTTPADRGFGRGFTRAVHQKDGQVQMGTQLEAGASTGGGRRKTRRRRRRKRKSRRKARSRSRSSRRTGGGIGASRMTGVSNMRAIAQHRTQIHDADAREIQEELRNIGLKITLAQAKKELKNFAGVQGQATHAYKALISKCCQSCRN